MIKDFLTSTPLWIVLVAILLFIIGFKVGKMILWGLAIILFITAESAGKFDAVSKAGAKGLMQLMDTTAAGLGVDNSFDPEQNIYGGTSYINKMEERFGGDIDLALDAYNARPGKVM